MEWVEALRRAIDFIEEHLLEGITVEDVAKEVYLSPFYFQKGFKLITGYTLSEYIRNRRLYLAALEVIEGKERVIDLAYKYGYDTPESFTKAFTRFHGVAPMRIKKETYKISTFQPLQISIVIKGGEKIEYEVEEMEAFEVIGIERSFEYEHAFEEIPQFWKQYCEEYIYQYAEPVEAYCLGMYGVCLEGGNEEKAFRYLIAGHYKRDGRELPEGLEIRTIPALTWAKFKCIGPMPQTLQALNNKIFNEWLPGNPNYKIAAGYNIEMYSKGDTRALDYVSEIWIPVEKK